MAGESPEAGILSYVRLYPDHFVGGITDLSCVEVGVYFRLLLAYYSRRGRPLPLMADRLNRVASAQTDDEREAVRMIVAQKFTRTPSGYTHARADRELARAQAAYDRECAASDRGRRAAQARHNGNAADEAQRLLDEGGV